MSRLTVYNLGKSYRQWGGEWRRILSWFFSKIAPKADVWTLKDISFNVEKGEAVGIIGQNGAGKSTLLKLITGVLQPSIGFVETTGKVAAILELGMGFNPDLSGRQNAYHSAGLMGYSYAEIHQAMMDIEQFAEVGDYFDQPVRTYSSGMQARVAFAVATAFRPDILIVDEVLSVGDIFFGIKCIERMEEFLALGTSILFVTHDMATLRRFCRRGIVLQKGQMVFDGDVLKAISLYSLSGRVISNATNLPDINEVRLTQSDYKVTVFSPSIAEVSQVSILNEFGSYETAFVQGETLRFSCAFRLFEKLSVPYFHLTILNSKNIPVYAKDSFQQEFTHERFAEQNDIIGFKGSLRLVLAPDDYVILLALHGIAVESLMLSGFDLLDFKDKHRKVIINAKVPIKVLSPEGGTGFYGLVDLPSQWSKI